MTTHEAKVEVEIDAQVIPKRGSLKYLGATIRGTRRLMMMSHMVFEWGGKMEARVRGTV